MSSARRLTLALGAAILIAACSANPSTPTSAGRHPRPSASTTIPAAGQTPGATSVRAFGATGAGLGDDTGAFLRAQDAAIASTVRRAGGPTGQAQAVVYVPPGTYRLLHLAFRSNVRMEVDAGAVLEQAGGRSAKISDGPASLIDWDALPGPPLANVSLVGVNTSTGALKALANPVFPGWDLSPDFTFDLDPAATNGSVLDVALQAANVSGFLIENVYSIQNDYRPAVAPSTVDGWWPDNQKAALGMRENPGTPADGSMFYDPHNGTVDNWYNIRGTKGYGPDQIGAGHNLTFRHIFTEGGTALRLETDASQGKPFASEIRGLVADDIAGLDCNRAVSFTPHAQQNFDVHVTSVRAVSCSEGVVESISPTGSLPPGAFTGSTISGVTVTAGGQAQNGVPGSTGYWTVGESLKAFAKDQAAHAPWSVRYGPFSCSGSFQQLPDRVMTASGLTQPVCAS